MNIDKKELSVFEIVAKPEEVLSAINRLYKHKF